MAYWPFTFRQLALFGIVGLSVFEFFYELNKYGDASNAFGVAIVTFVLFGGLVFGGLALWGFLKRTVQKYWRR